MLPPNDAGEDRPELNDRATTSERAPFYEAIQERLEEMARDTLALIPEAEAISFQVVWKKPQPDIINALVVGQDGPPLRPEQVLRCLVVVGGFAHHLTQQFGRQIAELHDYSEQLAQRIKDQRQQTEAAPEA